MLHKELTGKIINAYFKVYNQLGYGFLEKVYENALKTELQIQGLQCSTQYPIKVYYNKQTIGEYYADLIVENKIIVELKAAECLSKAHELQLLNYLRATTIEVGILFNFGKQPKFRRKIYTNKS